ncbi:unannotated protein [freshwater metagenome]|uniref:Unannotated protein n=1 Tax=freshwater metagenome TaxID=449393 RepID=A0A6J7DLE9_9ZZZZ|nr:hypothetical protein [Actinomycetota bacterium]
MRRLVAQLAVGTVLVCGALSTALPRASATGEVGTVCVDEPYSWSGNTTIGAGEAFFTGAVIADQPGTVLSVGHAGASTDAGSASLVVHIGSVIVTDGAEVRGGGISVSNDGPQAVQVTSVDIVVIRCQFVASESPALVASAATETSRVSADVLPSTGAASRGVAVSAVLCTMLGLAMVAAAGRRRRTT